MPIIQLPPEDISPGAPINLRFDKLPYGGPGEWVVADMLLLRFEVDVTVAGAALQGEDQWRILGKLFLKDASGQVFVNGLTGPQLRAAIYALQGQRVENEPADIGVGAGLIDVTFIVPLTIRGDASERARDYGLPIAAWKNGGDEALIQVASLADFTEGGSSVSAFGPIKRVTASIIYHTEAKPEFKVRPVWHETLPQNDAEWTVPIRGALQYMFLHKTGANGGASVAGVTAITSEHMKLTSIPRATLKTHYLRSREVDADDPFLNDKALALVYPEGDAQKLTELTVFPGEPVHFKIDGSLTGYRIVYCVLEERPDVTVQVQAARQGVTHTKPALAEKTLKTKDDLGVLRRIFPLKAAEPDEEDEIRESQAVHAQRRRVVTREHGRVVTREHGRAPAASVMRRIVRR